MNADVEAKINFLISQEQSLQEQLLSVQTQKTRLQTVLQVWNECKNDPTFYTYVAQVTENFKTVVPEPVPDPVPEPVPEPSPETTTEPTTVPIPETVPETTENTVEPVPMDTETDQTEKSL
jgi:type II secretory pathway pseudopilin PulG